jgi:microcystin-dependent protein
MTMDAFMGMITAVGFNYAPRGWMFCNGQTVAIQQNSAMFALLGTLYGGDGINTFGIPDLRGRVPIGSQGNGPGLSPIAQGEKAGTNNVTVIGTGQTSFTLNANNMPSHSHGATGLTATTTMQASGAASGGSLTPAEGSLLTGTAGGPTSAAIYLPATASPPTPVNLGNLNTILAGQTAPAGNGAAVVAPVQTQATVAIMPPYLGLNYIIAMEGIFPGRN